MMADSIARDISDDSQDHRRATLLEVGRLATTAGLHLAHAEDAGTFRWTRGPEVWSINASPSAIDTGTRAAMAVQPNVLCEARPDAFGDGTLCHLLLAFWLSLGGLCTWLRCPASSPHAEW